VTQQSTVCFHTAPKCWTFPKTLPPIWPDNKKQRLKEQTPQPHQQPLIRLWLEGDQQQTNMMLHAEMNPLFAAAAAAANGEQQQLSLFKSQNSFEDEVESIYLSSSDLKKQDQLLQRHQLLQDVPSKATTTTNLGLGLIKAGQDPYDSMDFAVAKPEDVTGQTLAYKVEDPEEDDVSNLLEANFDFSTLMDDTADNVSLAAGGKANGNTNSQGANEMEGQKFIEEMKEFLGRFETPAPPAVATNIVAQPTTTQEGMDDESLPESLVEDLLSMEQRITLNNMPESTEHFPNMDDADLAQAEEMLDLLLADVNGSNEPQQQQPPQQTDILHEAMISQNLHDSGFIDQEEVEEEEANVISNAVVIPSQVAVAAAPIPTYNVSNVTQFQTADGKKVIIVIQPTPAQAVASTAGTIANVAGSSRVVTQQPAVVAPPAVATVDDDVVAEDSSDSDWTPDEAAVARKTNTVKKRPGRKPEVRASLPVTQDGRVAKRSYKAITDRKKRKKLQNVEAARRYRDKKKQEQSEMETEEQILLTKNKELKDQLADIENEFKTMKKLMVELGLVKFVK